MPRTEGSVSLLLLSLHTENKLEGKRGGKTEGDRAEILREYEGGE